ncbi:Histidine phosphatase superfamily (branch 2) [Popillia japonica]|uniref:Multiple inositol polyphosphate phosphatase 1 n=1 Tax=Popillia japonica TaxID=7064 RepID=A0AAW1KMP8_POPJA
MITNHLGTKSPYRYVANINCTKDNNLQGCAKKIWMLVRHGTRNPNVLQIQKMQGYLPILKDIILERNSNLSQGYLPILKDIILERNSNLSSSKLQKSDIELFENWYPKVNEKDSKKLTIEGEHEMLELAERMQARFPDLLPPVYSNTSYKFKFTNTQRTKKSAENFAVGLFGKKTAKDVYFPEPIKHDAVLRFYKMCSKWISNVKHNDSTYAERQIFENSLLMKEALRKISKKLNFENMLSFDDVNLMYTTCAFETAWTSNTKSPWCIPFDIDTIKVMEYSEDLKYYWVDGYGKEITYKQACIAFNNMLNFMTAEDPYPHAVLYFTHSGTLLKMLSHLNLYREDKPLRAADYNDNHNRKWRVSKIDTFGSNLAFILHKCNGEKKLLVLHNEVPVKLPSCPDNELCDLQKIKDYYSSSITDCSFDSICENN